MPELSIIIPAFDEAEFLHDAVSKLLERLRVRDHPDMFEVLLVENGSTDGTFAVATRLAEAWPQVRVLRLRTAGYGRALRAGIEAATAERVVLMDVDLLGVEFVYTARALLERYDVVIGSKRLPGSRDRRPLTRRLTTTGFNVLVRALTGYRGTDTHGMKALDRSAALDALARCRARDEVFDTELVVRLAGRGARIVEVPVALAELRPTRQALLARLPKVARGLVQLARCPRTDAAPDVEDPQTHQASRRNL